LVMGPRVASPFSLWGFIDFGADSTAKVVREKLIGSQHAPRRVNAVEMLVVPTKHPD
jgi:hypothetical protein